MENLLHGSKICRIAPPVSHLLFMDDCLLFYKASEVEYTKLREVLDEYEEVSGQAINYGKSGIFFSRNIDSRLQTVHSQILGVSNPLNTEKYFGLPSLVERKKREICNYIKERLWKKLQGWKGKKLSKVGTEILIKFVAQVILSCCMSTFLLPSTMLYEMHRMMNAFWWGLDGKMSKSVKWMRWEKICVSKEARILGFRDLCLFNIVLLAKIVW